MQEIHQTELKKCQEENKKLLSKIEAMTKVYNSVKDAHQQLLDSQSQIETRLAEAQKKSDNKEEVEKLQKKLDALTKIHNSTKDAHLEL